MSPQTYADLAHENYMLLAALWRLAWRKSQLGGDVRYHCAECHAFGPAKHLVHHAPGCALFGVDRSILAQLDAFDAMPEPV